MIKRVMIRSACALLLTLASAAPALAQSGVGIRGFGFVGNMTFTAKDSFDAVFGTNKGIIFGGGADVLLPAHIFVEVGAWQFKNEGERVFVFGDEVFRLGIPVSVTITPLEISAGYRFTQVSQKLVPYIGGGYSSYRYRETSEFADPGENVDERFPGFHVLGGADYQVLRWLAVGGAVTYASIKDALGEGGVSSRFDEDDLGGLSLRLKISVGR